MKPEFLKPKDKIAIIAPAGHVLPIDLEAGLKLIESWNLEFEKGKRLYRDYYEGYHYAGMPEERLQDLKWALDSDEIKAVWFARGGYGSIHLLDETDWTKFREKPKWLIGYSDITAIHCHVNNWNIASLHGVTVKRLDREYTEETFESLKKVLFGEELKYEIPAHPLNKKGKVTGKLVGGNLSLIYNLSGTPSALEGENLILFIEDWHENWYHLDRMLMNLKRSGLLDRITAMIVGSFTRMDVKEENPEFESDYDSVAYKIIKNFIKEYQIPVAFGFPAGHIGDNRALILGTEAELKIKQDFVSLEFN